MANAIANHLFYLLATKVIDFSGDTFKIILMDDSFIFDIDAHEEYADVSANELGTAFGYTVGGATLAGVSVTENDVDDRTEVAWNNPSWTAAGGNIGPASGAIIYDDTAANDPIVGFIDFGTLYTQADGGVLTIANPKVYIRQPSA